MARRALTVAVLLLTATAVRPAAQAPSIAVESGTTRQLIARLEAGHWQRVADGGCTADGDSRTIASGAPALELPRRLTPGDDTWSLVRAEIERLFEQRQREHQLTASNIPGAAMTIDWVFADAGSDRDGTALYFEASRRVPDPGTAPDDDPRGTLRVTVSGWLRAQQGSVRTLGSKTELRWEQEPESGVAAPGPPDLQPLGIARQTALPAWVMKAQTGTIVRFLLYEVGGAAGVRTLFDVRSVRC